MAEIKVKDYILSKEIVDSSSNQNELVKQNKVSNTYTLEVVLENETDLILKRKTSKTEKELVLLFGQEQFYIRDCKNDTIFILKDVNLDKELKKFFNRTYLDSSLLNKVQYRNDINKDSIYHFINNKANILLIKNNLYERFEDIKISKNSILRYLDKKSEFYDKKFFIEVVETFPYCNDRDTFLQAEAIRDFLGNNLFYEFTKKYRDEDLSFRIDYSYYSFFRGMKNQLVKANLDRKKFIDYFIYGLRAQGFKDMYDALNIYIDYLNMANTFKGRTDKYPRYLKSEHDILATKINNLSRLEKDSIVDTLSTKYNNLEFEDKKYSIILPKTALDIIDEGSNLHHCVASYVNKVIKEQCTILFFRRTENTDESLITLEYNIANNVIVQARGLLNRNLTIEEFKFLKKYCKKKNIDIDENIKTTK